MYCTVPALPVAVCVPVGHELCVDEVEEHSEVLLLQLPYLHVVHLGVVLRKSHDLRLQIRRPSNLTAADRHESLYNVYYCLLTIKYDNMSY